jgi:uncharacterized membrane protein
LGITRRLAAEHTKLHQGIDMIPNRYSQTLKHGKESKKTLFQSLLLILVIFLFAPLIICSIFSIAELLAENRTGKYLYMTNIGFALFAGIATLMFNWSRSLDPKDYAFETHQINETGEHAIMGGIGFLLASLFQFIQIVPKNQGVTKLLPEFYWNMSPIMLLCTFILTSVYSTIVLFQIITVYVEVLHVRKVLNAAKAEDFRGLN